MSEESCEDICYISDDFIAVIDGVTSKSDFSYQGKTTGKLAAEIIASVLSELPKDSSVGEFTEKVNQKIQWFYEQISFPYSREEQGLQAVCAVYSAYLREIWLIGDCQVCVDGNLSVNPKRSDDILAEMRSLVLNIVKKETPAEFLLEETQKKARSLIEPWILKSTIFANDASTSYGYSVFNGKTIPRSLIKTICLDEKSHEVILTSDGYPNVESDLEKSEAYLRKILKEDKECCDLYHSTKGLKTGCKSFDDRVYIRFVVEQQK